MKRLNEMSSQELSEFHAAAEQEYVSITQSGLSIDISRGKPGEEQLALSKEMLRYPDFNRCQLEGIDARNYGGLNGLPSCRRLFAELLGVRAEQVFVGGNASLTLMYDTIAKAYTHGLLHSPMPWGKMEQVKFLCPAPGYDRHFAICESFGMEMITIPMTATGPSMDMVEEYVQDPLVKGMWCVPKFSNPDGIIYSEETVERIAALRPAAPDFTVLWDNAYCVHELEGDFIPFPDILSICEKRSNRDMVLEFASTSKITLPGAGVACFAASDANIEYFTKLISAQSISFDKMNQLRHVMFLQNRELVLSMMRQHAKILGLRFQVVLSKLEEQIAPLGIAKWSKPKGGYFISLYAYPGTAKKVYQLMKGAGVTMTAAGTTYPYGKDPDDSNLRIAPSYPTLDELELATDVLCVCLKLAASEKLLLR